MAFDTPRQAPRRIAVIGGGISGLAAAWMLAPQDRVTVYEAAPRFGGHVRTVMAGQRGDQPVDTGFIVFNHVNYPHLTRLFADLDVPTQPSDMSFGATIDGGRLEYALRSPSALFAQRRNLLRPSFARMLADIARFNSRAEGAVRDDMTIGELTRELGLGDWFRRYYLLPVSGAIWSTPPSEIEAFPARTLLSFFRNHGLMSVGGQHQWWTVTGGSIEYLRRLEANLRLSGVDLRPGTPVRQVQRGPLGVSVYAEGALPERYDQVIFACHSDQALAMIDAPTRAETAALSALRYQPNRAVLHRDPGQMPRRRGCWSSWVYQSNGRDADQAIAVTYWMNRLQNIPESDPLFLTLNPITPITEAAIYDETVFHHPVFDRAAIVAQADIAAIQGQNRTFFAGAYLRHGFHEDGFASAVRVARALTRQIA